nr:MAG TPA: hypothetical protein [Caudoviricetes sp.]
MTYICQAFFNKNLKKSKKQSQKRGCFFIWEKLLRRKKLWQQI